MPTIGITMTCICGTDFYCIFPHTANTVEVICPTCSHAFTLNRT
jgi:hypothetical protein